MIPGLLVSGVRPGAPLWRSMSDEERETIRGGRRQVATSHSCSRAAQGPVRQAFESLTPCPSHDGGVDQPEQ